MTRTRPLRTTGWTGPVPRSICGVLIVAVWMGCGSESRFGTEARVAAASLHGAKTVQLEIPAGLSPDGALRFFNAFQEEAAAAEPGVDYRPLFIVDVEGWFIDGHFEDLTCPPNNRIISDPTSFPPYPLVNPAPGGCDEACWEERRQSSIGAGIAMLAFSSAVFSLGKDPHLGYLQNWNGDIVSGGWEAVFYEPPAYLDAFLFGQIGDVSPGATYDTAYGTGDGEQSAMSERGGMAQIGIWAPTRKYSDWKDAPLSGITKTPGRLRIPAEGGPIDIRNQDRSDIVIRDWTLDPSYQCGNQLKNTSFKADGRWYTLQITKDHGYGPGVFKWGWLRDHPRSILIDYEGRDGLSLGWTLDAWLAIPPGGEGAGPVIGEEGRRSTLVQVFPRTTIAVQRFDEAVTPENAL